MEGRLSQAAGLPRLLLMTSTQDRTQTPDPRSAVVVGGGPAGLVAAVHLAGAGIDTTLLEARSDLGGRAATHHQEGFALNEGPHALYVGGCGMRELRAVGVDPERWNPTSWRSVFVHDGAARRMPPGMAAFGRWVARAVRTHTEDDLRDVSTAAWLDGAGLSADARALAAAFVRVTTFVADHDALSADVALGQMRIGVWPGVRYLKGGWQPMADALGAEAVRRGATLRTGARVRALERAGDGWTVTLDDGVLAADAVVLAAGLPAAAAALAGDRAPQAPGPAAEVSTLDLGLTRLPRPSRRFALGIDEATYLSKHSPPGHRGGTLLSLASYTRGPLSELEGIADTVQPGWREHVSVHRHLPKMVAVSALATPQTGGLAGRPSGDRGDGLHVAGDWIGPEGWLVDAALSSGAAAARRVVASLDRATAAA